MAGHRTMRVLSNANDVVSVLSEQGPMTPGQLAEALDIPRPSVYRLIEGMQAVGLTNLISDGRVGLSLRWLHLADSSLAAMTEWSTARSILENLAESTRQTAFLTVPRRREAVCIDWAPGLGIGVLILKPGRALPMYAGAAGRVLLAYAEDGQEFLHRAPFERFTASTMTSASELQEDMAKTRALGYVHSDQDATVGIGAVGAPVMGRAGQAIGCVSIGGPASDVRAHLAEYVAEVTEAARLLGLG